MSRCSHLNRLFVFLDPYTHPPGLAAAWGGSMAFDILIFGLTAYKSLMTYWRGTCRRLIDTMLRDGAPVSLSPTP